MKTTQNRQSVKEFTPRFLNDKIVYFVMLNFINIQVPKCLQECCPVQLVESLTFQLCKYQMTKCHSRNCVSCTCQSRKTIADTHNGLPRRPKFISCIILQEAWIFASRFAWARALQEYCQLLGKIARKMPMLEETCQKNVHLARNLQKMYIL